VICLACGEELPPSLESGGSVRCLDCRESDAPVRAELVTRAAQAQARQPLPLAGGGAPLFAA
jgi:hypothetical protein